MFSKDDPVELDDLSEAGDTKWKETESEPFEQSAGRQTRLIGRVLSPAVRLWLRSQLEHVEDLQIAIEAGDRQLLSGCIERVSASASKAVYQGLHLSQISVVGEQIQTNLRQVIRGKPFRLLEAFPVMGEVFLSEPDLNASLQAPLLANAVTDFLLTLLQLDQAAAASATLKNVQVELAEAELLFKGILAAPGRETAITIRTNLTVQAGNILRLEDFQCLHADTQAAIADDLPSHYSFNLGSEVFLETLTVQPGQLLCRGRVRVMP